MGFARIEEERETIRGHVALQGMQGKQRLEVYLLYEEDGSGFRKYFQSFEVRMPSVNFRIECQTGTEEVPANVVGVYLRDDGGDEYAVCWKNVEFSFADIRDKKEQGAVEEEKEKKDGEEQREVTQELEESVLEPKPLEEVPETEETKPKTREEFSQTEETGQKAKPEVLEVEEADALSGKETAMPEENLQEECEPDLKNASETVSEVECEAAQCVREEVEERSVRIEKIQREEIAKLPRCEWRLANNHFLIHGWRNYHHLALIEDDGKLFIGVPGIYHKREADAALAFGFPEFRSMPEEGVDEEFGYWCRQVRGNIIK